MRYVARAKKPGRCVIKNCAIPGTRIYHGERYRYLACSIVHAEEADKLVREKLGEIEGTPKDTEAEPLVLGVGEEGYSN